MEGRTGERLDNAVSCALKITRNKARKLIETVQIKVNEARQKPSYKIKAGDNIQFEPQEKFTPKAKYIPLNILYEDEHLIVLDKQKGLLCHPTAHEKETLVSALLFHTDKLSDIQGHQRRGIVHRLDKNTSGLMLAAKTNEAHAGLAKDIQTKKIIRKYLAVCHGAIEKDFGTINKPIVHNLGKTIKMGTADQGLEAVTHYRVLKRIDSASFLSVKLETGRTHQIRCHFASINHPLVGDDLYGAKGFQNGLFRGFKTEGQVLMSCYLHFTHPITSEIMEFEIGEENYHPDLKRTLKLLRSES